MAIRVLIVDDSGFFRRRLNEMLNSDPMIEVVDMAVDGKDAVAKVKQCKPDVVTMDIEMPVMNGIEATREIMKVSPTPVLIFSSLSYEGAQATLDALEAGATDFLPKRFDDISNNREEAQQILCNRVKTLGRRRSIQSRPLLSPTSPAGASRPSTARAEPARPLTSATRRETPPVARKVKRFNAADFEMVAIGTSTGGPVALQEVLTQLPQDFSLPLVLVQHMPATFTEAFAARLNQLCKISVREAKDGDVLEPGLALLAPGGKQMLVEKRGGRYQIKVREETDPMQNYKPCVDVTFESLAMASGKGVLGIIMTGMGQDGFEGCKKLLARQSTIWAQDEETSTIYGMPAAVADIAEQILPLQEIGKKLALNS